MDALIKSQEETHLKSVRSKIVNAKESYEKGLLIIGKDNLDRLKDIRESGETGADFEFLLQQLGEKNNVNLHDKFGRLQELEFLSREPYFSRLDLKYPSKDVTVTYYIGKFGYTEGKPVVIDWRARIASVFYRYRYPQKNVSYETSAGKETADLLLKRTFEIENGQLFKYFNNDLQLDESQVIIEKIKKRTGGVLEDIVETIQLSQINIIEADPRQVCIVQGCVGSGKSTVAIHKLAHIFFNYPNLIHPNKSILVAKNQILSGYLSTLFPKLGIFDINYKTLRELLYNVVFREELGLTVNLDKDQDTGDIGIAKMKLIDKELDRIHEDTESKINDIFSQSEFITFRGLKYSKLSTPYENISDILSDLEEELLTEKEYVKSNPDSTRSPLYKENLKALRRLITKLTDIKSDLKSKVLGYTAKSYGIDTKEVLGYRNALLYTYLYTEIIGMTKYPKFEYCVVDEGQDFSPVEYRMLSKLVMRGRFSIFGDLNQSLESDGIRKWDDIKAIIKEAKVASKYELDTNYRSTKEIVDLAKSILSPYSKKYLPKSIFRNGEEPKLELCPTEELMYEKFKEMISKDLEELNKSIGIISYDNKYSDRVNDIVNMVKPRNMQITELNEGTKIKYTPVGVYLSDLANCKGLEFSKVYVVGLNTHRISNLGEARRAFVAVTRAMNDVVMLGVE